ncbi:unnamed protein product [Closterium sp. NIES-64]|nr:unnamed protein product [Closterium sp. NIES-64]
MCRQELRDLQPTLLDAATYAEEAYLVTDQKDIELHNVRDYAVSMPVSVVDRIGLELHNVRDYAASMLVSVVDRIGLELYNVRDHAVSMLVSVVDSIGLLLLDLSMLVSVVDRIGAAADRFTDAVSLQAKEMVAADVRVASAAEEPTTPKGHFPSSPPRCTLEGLQVLMTWRAVIGGPPRHIGAAGSF